MSDKIFGMPGIGGSLGKCALCGENFLLQILLDQTVQTIELEGVDGKLCAHKDCVEKFHGKPITELPDMSPLKQAALKYNEDQITRPPQRS